VFAQDIQFHPVTDEPTHLDLYRVEPGQMIRVAIPVHVTGQGVSPGVKRGGAMNIVRHEIWLYAPADAIPEHLEADVSAMEIGDALKISAIQLRKACARPSKAATSRSSPSRAGPGRCGRRQTGCRC
jgi:large subunit ribosomal protein L25